MMRCKDGIKEISTNTTIIYLMLRFFVLPLLYLVEKANRIIGECKNVSADSERKIMEFFCDLRRLYFYQLQ